jgi:hypothetical protein
MRAPTLARGPLDAALALRAGRRALKLCYGLTDCSGGEFDLGAERRALPQFVHGFGNLRVRPTAGQHHAPPNLPGFPGSLGPPARSKWCIQFIYIAFTCESKCRVAAKPQALSPGPARCGVCARTHSDNVSQRTEMRLRRACLRRDRFALLAYTGWRLCALAATAGVGRRAAQCCMVRREVDRGPRRYDSGDRAGRRF